MMTVRPFKTAVLAVKVVVPTAVPLLKRVILVMPVAAFPVPVLVKDMLVTVTGELLGLFRTT